MCDLLHRQREEAKGDVAVGRWAMAVNNREAESKKSIKMDKIIVAIEMFGKFGLPAIYFAFNIIFFVVGIAAQM